MISNYSRCELGKRCIHKTKNIKVFVKYTLVCAINSKGIVGWILYESGGMTSDRMIQFINKFIKSKLKYHFQLESNIYTYQKLRRKVKKIIKKIPKNTLL